MAKGAPAPLHGYGKIKTSTLPGKSGAHEKDTGAEPWKLKSRTPHVKPTCGAPTFDFLKSKKTVHVTGARSHILGVRYFGLGGFSAKSGCATSASAWLACSIGGGRRRFGCRGLLRPVFGPHHAIELTS